MYPNYVGSEAVLASENHIFKQYFCDNEAFNACLHPFIRNTVGSMDLEEHFLTKDITERMTEEQLDVHRMFSVGNCYIIPKSYTEFCTCS